MDKMHIALSKDYMELAEQAAEFERNGHYQRAYSFWSLAANVTASEVNHAWAINRADFCSKPRASIQSLVNRS